MPFYMNEPTFNGSNISFSWDQSESLIGQSLVYDLDISTTKEFQAGTIVESIKNIAEIQYTLNWTHPAGTYYFRVRSRDVSNPQSWQDAADYDYNLTHDGSYLPIYGVKKMVVTTSGGMTANATDDQASVQLGNTVLVDVLANDSGTGITIAEVDDVWTGSVSIANGQIRYIANGSYTGNINIYYSISDSLGNVDWAKITMNISQSSPIFSAIDDSAIVNVGDTVLVDVLANDSGTGITIAEVDNVWTGSVSIVNGKIKYIASGTYTGTINIYYSISDSASNVDWAKISMNITQGAPTFAANDDSVTVKVGSTILIDALANDTGTGISLSEVDDVWSGSASIVNGKIEYIASGAATSFVNIYYGITDSNGDVDWAKVVVHITQ